MYIQQTMAYRIATAFLEGLGMFFGFHPMELDRRTVCEGVCSFEMAEGDLVYVLSLQREQNMQDIVAVLHQKMEGVFLRERITMQILGGIVIFLWMPGRPIPYPSLMFVPQGLELLIPASFFIGSSGQDAYATEVYWDALAKEMYLALQ